MVLQSSVAEHSHAAHKGQESSILESQYDETMRTVAQSSIPECRIPLPFTDSHTRAQDSITTPMQGAGGCVKVPYKYIYE